MFLRLHLLIEVHNLADVPTQLGILKEMKSEGRVKYIGVTTTASRIYQETIDIMKNNQIDFIGIDYAIDDRDAAESLIPAAQDYGVAVMVYLPFGRSRLWSRVRGQAVPEWSKEFHANTWAQFFLKYLVFRSRCNGNICIFETFIFICFPKIYLSLSWIKAFLSLFL